jgi:hypothetical protein
LLGGQHAMDLFGAIAYTNVIAVMGTYVLFTYIIPARRAKPATKVQ